MDYGERLKMYRKHAGLTQKQLAEKLGIDNTTISKWENGEYRLDVEKLGDLATALNITVNDLIGFHTDFSLDQQEEQLLRNYRKLTDINKNLLLKIGKAFIALENQSIEKIKESFKNSLSHPVFLMPASAGTGTFLDSDQYELVDFPEDVIPRESNFAVRVSGNSMEPDYPDGSIVFVKQTKHLEPGDVGIFIVNNEGYLKVLGDHQNLESINPDYSDIKLKEWDDCRIVGKVVGNYNE